MSSSSSSSPEISPAGRADSPHERYATHEDVLEDLQSRFILNLPEEELSSLERVCFQVEQAHWFYEDFVREENPRFPSLPLKKFSAMLFESCPLLHQWSGAHEQAFTNFMQYKTRVPVCGAIMLNDTWEKCLLVKGWKSSSGWGFPKGKINEDEPQPACAVREVLEETGYNLAGQINPDDVIEMSIKEQKIALYIVPGVPEDFAFKTKTRKEISKIEWFKLSDLPTWKRNKSAAGKFYLITPFIGALKAFIHDRKPRNLPRKPPKSKRQNQREPAEPVSNGHDSAVSDSPSTPYQDAHQESSSQSSSADNGEPQTPSPQCSQSFADPVNVASQSEASIDPHFARLLSSLTMSGVAAGPKKEEPIESTLPITHRDGPRERNTPVPAIAASERYLPDTSSRSKSPFVVGIPLESGRISSVPPHERQMTSSPSSHFSVTSRAQLRSPQPTEVSSQASPLSSATTVPSRPLGSRRTSSVADISPYLSKAAEIPTSAKRLKQLALLESIADESARMSPFVAGREGAPASGLNPLNYPPPLPPASVPPQAFGFGDPNVIYSSSPNAAAHGMNIPVIPQRPTMNDDPFQVRPRTSQAINRPIYHSTPAASMSMNQSQLLALMNASGPLPPISSRPPLPQFHQQRPPIYNNMPPSSPYSSPLMHTMQPGAYPPSPLHAATFSAQPPPGIITSSQPLPPTLPPYGQPNTSSSLLSILNQRR
ncbi:mRNA-decapping enzyme subunit 2 [Marasmius tenuissimus]|nr:mRNA-decapping enzyme subunit 2 [Marasmius tenuissimus]